MSTGRRAVFLDRDGVLVEDVGYLNDPGRLRVLPGVPEALRRLKEAGFLLIVVTNQSAVARGWLTEEQLELIHRRLNAELAAQGAELDAFYYCPHLPDGAVARYALACSCRKPAPGMLLRAATELGVDLAASYSVGDSPRDAQAGASAGCYTITVGDRSPAGADGTAATLREAAAMILAREAPAAAGRR